MATHSSSDGGRLHQNQHYAELHNLFLDNNAETHPPAEDECDDICEEPGRQEGRTEYRPRKQSEKAASIAAEQKVMRGKWWEKSNLDNVLP